jgi:hypothetical protein
MGCLLEVAVSNAAIWMGIHFNWQLADFFQPGVVGCPLHLPIRSHLSAEWYVPTLTADEYVVNNRYRRRVR